MMPVTRKLLDHLSQRLKPGVVIGNPQLFGLARGVIHSREYCGKAIQEAVALGHLKLLDGGWFSWTSDPESQYTSGESGVVGGDSSKEVGKLEGSRRDYSSKEVGKLEGGGEEGYIGKFQLSSSNGEIIFNKFVVEFLGHLLNSTKALVFCFTHLHGTVYPQELTYFGSKRNSIDIAIARMEELGFVEPLTDRRIAAPILKSKEHEPGVKKLRFYILSRELKENPALFRTAVSVASEVLGDELLGRIRDFNMAKRKAPKLVDPTGAAKAREEAVWNLKKLKKVSEKYGDDKTYKAELEAQARHLGVDPAELDRLVRAPPGPPREANGEAAKPAIPKQEHAIALQEIIQGLERKTGFAKKADILEIAEKEGIPASEAEAAVERLKGAGAVQEPSPQEFRTAPPESKP